MNMKKHVGTLKNTGVKVAVVFRKIPEDEENCLVIETDHLPDRYHDDLMRLLNSKEALQTNDFYEVLNRSKFSDGTSALQTMHFKGFLRKVPIDNVTLIPMPGQQLDLRLANAAIDGEDPTQLANRLAEVETKKAQEAAAKTNTSKIPPKLNSTDPVSIAKGLLLEAELLQETAKKKVNEAYALAPELKPDKTGKQTRGRPQKTDAEKSAAKEAAKIKRREKDRERRAQKKADALDHAVNEKVARDNANA